MKKTMLIAAASGALLLSPAASAQVQQDGLLGRLLGSVFGNNQQTSEQTLEADWDQRRRPFAQRGPVLDQRIDAAVRAGSLDREEADDMRREYDDIVRLEAQYSSSGTISREQRNDLRMRYRALNQRVNGEGNGQGYGQRYGQNDDRDYSRGGNRGRWQPVATRNAEFEQRVAAGLRNRSLTQVEATRLRTEWRALGQLEATYQRGGIDTREQADLWSRYEAIDSRLGGSFGGSVGSGNDYASGYGNDRNTARWTQLGTRLASAERAGTISRVEAVQVRAQLADLGRLDVAYAGGGYTADERSYLTRRYAELDQLVGTGRR